MKGNQAQVAPHLAEGVEVAVPGAEPVHEPDAQLERPLRLAEEIVLIDPER
jgi:hypothetical protein